MEEEQCPAPGLGLAVTLECLQGSTSLGAAYEFAVYPDLGASIGGAADQPLDTAFATTFDCGAPTSSSTFASASVTLYDPSDVQLEVVSGLPVPSGSATLGTPASYGLAVGDVVSLYLNCFATSGGSPFVAGYRAYSVTVAAATIPADPPASSSGGGSSAELAATGSEVGPQALAGVLLVVTGVVIHLARRRVRRPRGAHRVTSSS